MYTLYNLECRGLKLKEFTGAIWAGFLTLVIISVPWFVIGYFLQNYVGVSWIIAYAVFPVIYFGFKDCAKEALVALLGVALIGGIWYGTRYIFQTVLLFSKALAYTFFPVIFIMFNVFFVIMFPVGASKESEDGF